ncbi:MAG TPA: 2-oxoglutarate and iron-dependent oxygenase domain-containing protein, partial [Holophagaceae bacterium]|nr:2-oxoglutarate and iron-dependent oxygenase domain-containing protein [Holophagaceae bacterium]
MSSFQVETVHLGQFSEGSPQDRAEFVQVLGRSLVDTGFVKVDGHKVTKARVDAAYRDIEAFFALPEAAKRAYLVPGTGGARGFTAFGSEHAKDNPVGDLKEFWHIGQDNPPGGRFEGDFMPNLWPVEVPSFKANLLGLFTDLEACAGTLLEAIALYLGLPQRHLADMVVSGNSILRLIHYPALKERYIEGGVRASAHEDINLITLLPAATESGLELLDRDGKWHAVDGLEGEIVADAGDMLSRHVNAKIPSTTHRVVNPKSPDTVRYSMPFFCHPRPEVLLDCPAEILEPGERRRF